MQGYSKGRSEPVSTEATKHQDWIPLAPWPENTPAAMEPVLLSPEDRDVLLHVVMKEIAF